MRRHPRLTIASIAVDTPMGAQLYQEEVAKRAPAALGALNPAWQVRRLVVRSMRARITGNRRLPLGRVATASAAVRREAGRLLYAGDAVSHRMNLELPPSPHRDVITLHDVVAWRFPDESPPVPAAIEEARRAAAVICVSEFSANEAIDLLGIVDPHVIHNGVDARYLEPAPLDPAVLADLGIDGRYVLTAGGAARRKNLEALADAWRLVADATTDLTLALAGPAHERRSELFGGLPRVRLLGRLPDEFMPGLYAAASAVVVPSLYEGFGLPALEGMAAGVPVVAARTSALPEVVGDGGLLVEPTGKGLAEGILHAVSDDTSVRVMAARGLERARAFTWERCAAEHAKVWASVT